jgi:hypothetical protein
MIARPSIPGAMILVPLPDIEAGGRPPTVRLVEHGAIGWGFDPGKGPDIQ